MGDSAVVIIATIGKETLSRAVESVVNQTHRDTRCLVVADGSQFQAEAERLAWQVESNGMTVDVLTLPQNTGANGYRCFRIYGAMPMIVNEGYIFYLDDDNWYDPDHVRNCIKACEENGLEWCFAMRNIYQNGEFLCRDECESVGLWPVWYSPDFNHIDTNCYCLKRNVAVNMAKLWHSSRFDANGNVQPSADTTLCNALRKSHPMHAMVPQFTVNYELGSWELSPKPEFFTNGNVKFVERHGGRLPWEASIEA